MTDPAPRTFGVVAIGRNEGERLKRCLTSINGAARIVYVDSGSTDGSVAWAEQAGIDVVALDMSLPFTAARARNAGMRRLRQLAPEIDLVQFVDGDCELQQDWPAIAITYLVEHPQVCATFGRRRERFPERSIYNLICDREWDTPVGEAKACGGDVMMRVDALEAAGGYRDDLIAGEEPELCVRLRAGGWKIWRLDHDMTLHDAAMHHFSQWWRRQARSGYGFAQGAHLHGRTDERHWVWESRRALLWAILIPSAILAGLLLAGPLALLVLLIYPAQVLRRSRRMSGRWRTRLQLAFFEQLSRFPEAWGQLLFFRNRLLGRHGRLIEYK
ncbi:MULTISPECIES: glycosyltransferase [Bradyrhizobium]|jgi:glycosyltransferase involved in cell wall biosynthesis|uniref:glycosyltransferase n=1 Tax=Bradyrhizobium TaxID=374 RepID=UPI00039E538E|nr:glycosyltransferase [Bradyrhizobium denitrificans]MCL8485467.1 glycosyltransferase [Bradyrhizobium denitrificans]RTM05571.1 MAG: glycosyltransferase [Bradyrhizobiaceae bacterium]